MVRKKPALDLKGAQSIQADSTHEIVSSGAEILMTDSLRSFLRRKDGGHSLRRSVAD
jgi:hypothetical protein